MMVIFKHSRRLRHGIPKEIDDDISAFGLDARAPLVKTIPTVIKMSS